MKQEQTRRIPHMIFSRPLRQQYVVGKCLIGTGETVWTQIATVERFSLVAWTIPLVL